MSTGRVSLQMKNDTHVSVSGSAAKHVGGVHREKTHTSDTHMRHTHLKQTSTHKNICAHTYIHTCHIHAHSFRHTHTL